MKRTKTKIAVALLLSLLLSGCGGTAPQPPAETAEPVEEPAVSAEMELAPVGFEVPRLSAPGAAQTAPVSVKNTLFRAKFEGSAVAGSGEAVDGVYRFIATETDGEAWHVKLECNYPTVSGRDYRVTYRFRSDVAGKVKFGDFQEFAIREGENSVTGILTATGGTSYLDLQLGMLRPFTIDFTEIEVEEYTDDLTYENALSEPVNFEKETRVYEKHDQGYAPVLARTADGVAIRYVAAAWEPGVWKSRLYVKTGLIPEKGARYRVTVAAACDADMPFEILFNDGDIEKGYGALYGQKLTAGEVTDCEAVISGGGDGEELVLQFSLGEAPEESVVRIGDLHVEKISDRYTSELAADFALDTAVETGRILSSATPVSYQNVPLDNFSYAGTDTVYEGHDDGYVVRLEERAESASLTVAQAPADAGERGVWKAKLYAATGVTPEAGATYRIRFDLASAADQAEYEACFDGDYENAYGALYARSLTAGGTDRVEYVVTPDVSHGPLTIRLQLGKTDTAAGNTVTLSNLSVEKLTPQYRPAGTVSYATEKTGNVSEEHSDGVRQTLTAADGAIRLDVTEARSEGGVWSSKLLIRTGVVPEPGARYRVSTTLSATADTGDFELLYQNAGGAELYGGQWGLSGGGSCGSDFVAPDGDCGELVLVFQLGNTAANNTITVTDVQVRKLSSGTGAEVALPGFAYPVAGVESVVKNSFDLETNSGAAAALTGDGSSATATVTTPGDDWHVKLYAKPGLTLEAGQEYTISMDVAGAAGCTACYKNTATGAEDGFGTEPIGSGTVIHTVTPDADGTLEILLKIGNVPAGTAVTVSNVRIRKTAAGFSPVSLSGFAYPTVTAGSTEKNSFELEANSGAAATLTGDGSSATALVTTPGDDWHVKLYAKPGFALEAGKTYQITMDVTGAAGCTACYKNTATGAEDGFGTEAIGSGTVTHVVTAAASGTLEILLKIGNVPAGTAVTVSGIAIAERTETAEDVLPAPVGYPDSFALESNSGAAATLSGAGGSATATVTTPGDDWHVKFYVKPQTLLEAGKTYQVSLHVTNASGCPVCFKNLATGAEDGFGIRWIGSADQTVTHTITPDADGMLELLLKIGNVPAGTAVTVSDVEVSELTAEFVPAELSGFAYPVTVAEDVAYNSFDLEANSGAAAVLTGNGTSATATVTTPGDDWHVKLYAKPGVELKAGRTYQISMNVTGAAGCTACYKNTATGAEDGFGTEPIGTGAVVHTVTPNADGTLELLLKIGNVPAGTEVTVSDVRIAVYETGDADVTPDGFAYPEMTTGGVLYNSFNLEAINGAAAELTGDGSSATATVTTPGSDWNVKFYVKPGIVLTAGQTYTVTVNVTGAAGCQACFKNMDTGAEEGFGAKTVGGSSVTQTVTAAESGTLEILLKIGDLPAGSSVTVTGVSVKTRGGEILGDDLATAEPIAAARGGVNFWAHEDYAAALSGDDGSVSLAIGKAPTEGAEAWKVKLFMETGIPLKAGKHYRISADVRASAETDL